MTRLRRLVLGQEERADPRHDQEQLDNLAADDGLTGLSNRALFNKRLVQAVARARRQRSDLAVLYLDLDRFGQFNDERGRRVGDQVLSEFARRIKGVTRVEDTLARMGGDEFAVLIEDVGSADALVTLSYRMIAEAKRPFDLEGQPRSGVSIGIALCRRGSGDADGLLRDADAAMSRARNAGGNRCEWAHRAGAAHEGR